MSLENGDVKIDTGPDRDSQSAAPGGSRGRLWLNWGLALLTLVTTNVSVGLILFAIASAGIVAAYPSLWAASLAA